MVFQYAEGQPDDDRTKRRLWSDGDEASTGNGYDVAEGKGTSPRTNELGHVGQRLRTEADQLRERFNRDFWINERGGLYALGLGGEKRQIGSTTSNMGNLLWSGILPQQRAGAVARHESTRPSGPSRGRGQEWLGRRSR